MSNTSLMEKPAAPVVTAEQAELFRRTYAKDATDDELKLHFFNCARHGVHPMDGLLHFTKRAGKYTPVTSIDFMRIRAAETGEYAGSDDAVFASSIPDYIEAATVTVWRLVQGQRCSFTATARWAEYKPENDFMWRKMPHTMLAKCAEALALRKGFPRQLAGLYAREEMDQAGPDANGSPAPAPTERGNSVAGESARSRVAPSGGETSGPQSIAYDNFNDGLLRVARVDRGTTRKAGLTKYTITMSTGEQYSTIKERVGELCQQLMQDGSPVYIGPEDTKTTQWGADLLAIHRVDATLVDRGATLTGATLTDDDIPF